jgi:predicted nucleic acid-binding protein
MGDKIIFVDTSWLIALNVETDKFYPPASSWWRKNKGVELATTNAIVWETLGWMKHKVGLEKMKGLVERLMTGEMRIERITLFDEKAALKYFKELPGRGVSMIDCLSMAVMKRLKIKKVLTFDADFEKAGFEIISG